MITERYLLEREKHKEIYVLMQGSIKVDYIGQRICNIQLGRA
jgi:hypothetical protein